MADEVRECVRGWPSGPPSRVCQLRTPVHFFFMSHEWISSKQKEMYPRFYFRGNSAVVEEFMKRKNDKLAEVGLMEEYYGMPRQGNDIYDDIDILIDMKRGGWDVTKLPRYEIILQSALTRNIVV